MTIEFTPLYCIKVVLAMIMVFAAGMSIDVEDGTRKVASIVYKISLALLWVFIMLG